MLHVPDNRDPFRGAFMLSRGLVGPAGSPPTVARPIFEQRFDLRTGTCLTDPEVAVAVHDVRCLEGSVERRLARGLP